MNLDASLLLAAAASAAGAQQYPTGALYVVATPIGNLADITLRALHVLSLVDAVACEDTRVSSSLLRHLGLDKPLIALHEHNERSASAGICARLARGERVAYVSDAGTPAVSDPGAALVKTLQSEGHRCIPVPGASSIVAALSVAGDPLAQGFAFVGFLPPKGSARDEALRAIAVAPSTQVLLEAPHRVTALAEGLASVCPERRLTLCRELTKQFETVQTLVASELPAWLAGDPNRLRGEFVLVLHAKAVAPDQSTSLAAEGTLRILLRELPLKQAVALTAEISGTPRKALYARALELRGAEEP